MQTDLSIVTAGFPWVELLALAGALSWLPHVVKWFAKPTITVVPASSLELGFTAWGPILNLTVAFKASKADALLTNFRVRIRHEAGRESRFVCTHLQENTGFVQSTGGEAAIHQRQQSAIAIAVTRSTVSERKLLGQHKEFIERKRTIMHAFLDAVRRIQAANPNGWQPAALESAAYQELLEFYQHSFVWEIGLYQCTLTVHVNELGRDVTNRYSFEITAADLAQLESNRNFVEPDLRQTVRPDPARPQTIWNWVYPELGSEL